MSVVTEEPDTRHRPLISTVWPAALGLLAAVGIGYGLTDGRDIAAVVAASGFIYVAAAALGRPGLAWPAFGVTFVVIGLGRLLGFDPVPWLLAGAAVVVVVGLARGRARPGWALPLQSAAMIVLGAAAVLAGGADPTVGGLLVAVALLAHAAWDVYHHRTGRVVAPSLAEFCAVLDVVVAVIVAAVALSS